MLCHWPARIQPSLRSSGCLRSFVFLLSRPPFLKYDGSWPFRLSLSERRSFVVRSCQSSLSSCSIFGVLLLMGSLISIPRNIKPNSVTISSFSCGIDCNNTHHSELPSAELGLLPPFRFGPHITKNMPNPVIVRSPSNYFGGCDGIYRVIWQKCQQKIRFEGFNFPLPTTSAFCYMLFIS